MAEVKIEYGDIPGGFRARINPKLDWLIVIRDKPGSSWRDPAQVSDLASNNASRDRQSLSPRGSMLSSCTRHYYHSSFWMKPKSRLAWRLRCKSPSIFEDVLRIFIARSFESITTNSANS